MDSRFDSHALEENQVEAYLLDTPSIGFGGSGIPFDWKLVAGFQQRIILAGGLSGENVAAAIAAVRPWGVDACSRLESSPGKKDPQKMRDFVSAALAAQHALKTVDPSHQEISL